MQSGDQESVANPLEATTTSMQKSKSNDIGFTAEEVLPLLLSQRDRVDTLEAQLSATSSATGKIKAVFARLTSDIPAQK